MYMHGVGVDDDDVLVAVDEDEDEDEDAGDDEAAGKDADDCEGVTTVSGDDAVPGVT